MHRDGGARRTGAARSQHQGSTQQAGHDRRGPGTSAHRVGHRVRLLRAKPAVTGGVATRGRRHNASRPGRLLHRTGMTRRRAPRTGQTGGASRAPPLGGADQGTGHPGKQREAEEDVRAGAHARRRQRRDTTIGGRRARRDYPLSLVAAPGAAPDETSGTGSSGNDAGQAKPIPGTVGVAWALPGSPAPRMVVFLSSRLDPSRAGLPAMPCSSSPPSQPAPSAPPGHPCQPVGVAYRIADRCRECRHDTSCARPPRVPAQHQMDAPRCLRFLP